MNTALVIRPRARIVVDRRGVDADGKRASLVHAHAEADAREPTVRAALRRDVAPGSRIPEAEHAHPPGAAHPAADIRAIELCRKTHAAVVGRLTLVKTAHRVLAAHAELLARHERITSE